MSNVLVLDIETKPALVYAWQARDVTIVPDAVVDPGGVLCWAAKWLDSGDIMFNAEWQVGSREMLKELYDLLVKADAVITYNGDKFDLPKLRGAFALHGLPPFPPVTSIDVYKLVRRFGLFISKLAAVAPLFGVGGKAEAGGFKTWTGALAGDPKAQAQLRRYNQQDVLVLERLYNKLRPHIEDHPRLEDNPGVCGSCGSTHFQRRGWRRSKFFKTERLQCQKCGSWSSGRREKC